MLLPAKLACFHDKECVCKLELVQIKCFTHSRHLKVESPLIVREQLGLLVGFVFFYAVSSGPVLFILSVA
jgi:hypothetical protein